MRRLLVLFFVTTWSLVGKAFPEMIRHGYVNCSACHTTAQGGDRLSPYGQELSKELLSRNDSIFRDSNSEKKVYELESPQWLQLGAHLRFLQSFSESSVASKGRFMIMQVETEALMHWHEEYLVYATLGRFEATKSDAEWKDFIYIPALWGPLSEKRSSAAHMDTSCRPFFSSLWNLDSRTSFCKSFVSWAQSRRRAFGN